MIMTPYTLDSASKCSSASSMGTGPGHYTLSLGVVQPPGVLLFPSYLFVFLESLEVDTFSVNQVEVQKYRCSYSLHSMSPIA